MRSQIRNLNESRPFYSRPCAAPVPRACCSWGLQLASWLLCALRGSRRHQQPVCCFQVLDDSWDRPSLQEMLMLMRMQRRKILWVFIDLGFFWGDGCLAVTSLKQDVKYFLYSWVLLFVFFFFPPSKMFYFCLGFSWQLKSQNDASIQSDLLFAVIHQHKFNTKT